MNGGRRGPSALSLRTGALRDVQMEDLQPSDEPSVRHEEARGRVLCCRCILSVVFQLNNVDFWKHLACPLAHLLYVVRPCT